MIVLQLGIETLSEVIKQSLGLSHHLFPVRIMCFIIFIG